MSQMRKLGPHQFEKSIQIIIIRIIVLLVQHIHLLERKTVSASLEFEKMGHILMQNNCAYLKRLNAKKQVDCIL